MPALIGILTVSDRASQGAYPDEGGPAIRDYLCDVLATTWEPREKIVPDDLDAIMRAIREVTTHPRGSTPGPNGSSPSGPSRPDEASPRSRSNHIGVGAGVRTEPQPTRRPFRHVSGRGSGRSREQSR